MRKVRPHKRGLGTVVRIVQSDHRSFVRRAGRFHPRALKGGAIVNTTHSSSLAADVPAYAQLQREMHDPRKARPEGSQFPRTGWIAQLVHTVCSVVAPRCDRTGCRRRRSGDALLAQHPDWIVPNSDCPTCDAYDARFGELLIVSLATERALAHRPNNLNLANTTKLPTFLVSHMWGAVAITRSRPSVIRKCSHEKFV